MRSYLCISLFCLTVCLTGCDIEPGGGASVVPAVTILPADIGGDSDAGGSEDVVVVDAGSSAGSGPGTFTGRVVLTGGDAPSLPPLISAGAAIKDQEVCAAVDMPDEKLVVGEGNGVANVFVYLARAPKGTPKMTPPAEPLIFDQKNCRFIPHCMIVPTGQTVKVLSDDPVAHNTHTNPKKNSGLSSLVGAGDREGKLELVYARAEEPFAVTCDFHAWMMAYHLPVDHPFAAVTDENGNFTIPDLPSGEHEFSVWHEAANGKFVERKFAVTITAGETTTTEIPYPVSKLSL